VSKTFLIFKHELFKTISKIGFIMLTLTVPVLSLLSIGAYHLISGPEEEQKPEEIVLGFVDHADLLSELFAVGTVSLKEFANEEEAREELFAETIAEYFVVPADYTETGKIHRYTPENELMAPWRITTAIRTVLAWNLMKDMVPEETGKLILSPLDASVTRITQEGEVEISHGNFAHVVVPGIFALLLGLCLMFCSVSLIHSLGEEKESRLIEVLFSSVSIGQLLIGKVLALGLAGLIQVLVWLLSAPLLINLAGSDAGDFFENIEVSSEYVFFGICYFLLGYLLFAVLSIGVSSISSNAKEAGNLSTFYIILGMSPMWFMSLLYQFPGNLAWTLLSLFPVTAPVQMMLRVGMTDIPMWEIVASFSIMILAIVFGLYAAIKTFRVHMLMYGKNPTLGEIWRNIRRSN